MNDDKELDELVKEMNYKSILIIDEPDTISKEALNTMLNTKLKPTGGKVVTLSTPCEFCEVNCENPHCYTNREKTVKEKLAECIESYLTETDTSDIFENADYHGRILSSILISEGFVKE